MASRKPFTEKHMPSGTIRIAVGKSTFSYVSVVNHMYLHSQARTVLFELHSK